MKYGTNELTYETKTDPQMYRTDLWLPRVGVGVYRVEMDCVFGISRHKLVYIGWINNEPLLFST